MIAVSNSLNNFYNHSCNVCMPFKVNQGGPLINYAIGPL